MRFVTIAPPPIHVESPEEVEECIRRCMDSSMLGVDTETLGLLKDEHGVKYHQMTDQIVVMGLSPDEGSRYLIRRKSIHQFKGLLQSPTIPKALANVKFDAHRFANTCGIDLAGPWVDTVHLDFMLDEDTRENRHGLKQCTWDYFNIPMLDYKELFGTLDPREFVPGHSMWGKYLDYSSLDPWVTRKLALHLASELSKIYVWRDFPDRDQLSIAQQGHTLLDMYWQTEEKQLKTLFRMERRGICVSRERMKEIEISLDVEMQGIARELNRIVGRPFNPNSGPQIGELLFEERCLPNDGKTATGKWKTSKTILQSLVDGHDCVEAKLIIQYKEASKLKGTYATGLLKWIHTDGRIHTSYSAQKTTGRLGSKSPNLQNVPRPDNDPHHIRRAFTPRSGCKFIVADYGQLEMRILAFVAASHGDSTMLDAIMAGRDMHSFTGCRMMGIDYDLFVERKNAGDVEVKGIRTAAKSVGFGIVYGISEAGLSVQLTKALGRGVSKEEARGYIDMYLDTFPGVKRYMQYEKWFAKKHGYVLTLCGRPRRLSKIRSARRPERGHAERQSINAPIQGSAADIVKRAMILCEYDPYLRDELDWKLLHQVHDELIFEGPEENAEEAFHTIKHYMQHPFDEDLPVILEVEPAIVNNWEEGK